MLRSITKFTTLCLLGLSALTATAGEWIIHVTPDNGPYKTEILVANAARNTGSVTFKHPSQELYHTVNVDGGDTLVLSPSDFPFYPMASLEITSRSSAITVSSRYNSPDLEVPLTVPSADTTANVFRFNNPSPHGDWQGLAIINLGNEVAATRIVQYDVKQQVIYEASLTDLLLPNSKYLRLLSALPLAENPDSYFEVQSSQPMSALLLTGGETPSGKGYLTANRSVAEVTNAIRVYRTGGFADVKDTVIIEGRKFCSRSGFGTRYTETCDALSEADLQQLDQLVASTNVTNLLVEQVEPFENNCADQFFYTVEISWNGQANQFHYDDCSILHMSNSQAAKDFVAAMFEFADSLTTDEVTQ